MTWSRITVDPNMMGGVPCIRGVRVPVATIVLEVADGVSFDEILVTHDELEHDDIREALRYAAVAVAEGERPILGR